MIDRRTLDSVDAAWLDQKAAVSKQHRDAKRAERRCINEHESAPHELPIGKRTKCEACLRIQRGGRDRMVRMALRPRVTLSHELAMRVRASGKTLEQLINAALDAEERRN